MTFWNQYTKIKTLQSGSQGMTYLASGPQGQVVVKSFSLKDSKNWKQLELFEREARALKSLTHPQIPRLLDFQSFEIDNDLELFLVTEYIEAPTLDDLIKQGWASSEEQVKELARQILQLLTYLHTLNPPVIHRDIKPSNLLLDQLGRVYLIDFGGVQLSHLPDDKRGSTVIGTYGYMAPEQFAGKASPQSDLYGLGTTLVHILSGLPPSEMEQKGLHLNFEPHISVSASFKRWLLLMLAPNPNDRIESATKALVALHSVSELDIQKSLMIQRSQLPNLEHYGISITDVSGVLKASVVQAKNKLVLFEFELNPTHFQVKIRKRKKLKTVLVLELSRITRCYLWNYHTAHGLTVSYRRRLFKKLPFALTKQESFNVFIGPGVQELIFYFNARLDAFFNSSFDALFKS